MPRRTTRRLLQCWLTALLVLLLDDNVVDGFLSSSSTSAPCQNASPRSCPQIKKRVLRQPLHANRNKDQDIPINFFENDDSREDANNNLLSRRRAFHLSSSCLLAVTTAATITHDASTMTLAATPDASSTAAQVFLRLKNIPTFCIVDPNGVPFMIFDGQASAMGYFFLSFDIAAQALKDARQKDTNQGAGEVWEQAKIIVVPLAVALQVTLRKSQRPAVNAEEIKFKTYGDIVPSQEGIDDAKVLDSSAGKLSNKWEQKGRVPLFYIEGLTLENGQIPRYFNRRDLLQEWTKQHPPPPAGDTSVEPQIQVMELVELFRTALPSLEALEKITLVPVAESNLVASRLLRESKEQGINLPKYDFNKVYLVGKAQG